MKSTSLIIALLFSLNLHAQESTGTEFLSLVFKIPNEPDLYSPPMVVLSGSCANDEFVETAKITLIQRAQMMVPPNKLAKVDGVELICVSTGYIDPDSKVYTPPSEKGA